MMALRKRYSEQLYRTGDYGHYFVAREGMNAEHLHRNLFLCYRRNDICPRETQIVRRIMLAVDRTHLRERFQPIRPFR
jgi:hypothetical protein